MISIQLISNGESHLTETLESIRKQDFNDYEIVCTDSSGRRDVEKLLGEYGCRTILMPEHTNILNARYQSHIHSRGDWCLLLDSTRPLKENALDILMERYSNYDMTIIKEDSLGSGFWVKQAKKLADISISQCNRLSTETLAFLLPRFYKRSVLDFSFSAVREIAKDTFNRISYGDHQLIFEGARGLSRDIGFTEERLILHFEDDSLARILRKYHRYGVSQRTLNLIGTSESKHFFSHARKNIPIIKRIDTLPISIARTVPFLFGYFLI